MDQDTHAEARSSALSCASEGYVPAHKAPFFLFLDRRRTEGMILGFRGSVDNAWGLAVARHEHNLPLLLSRPTTHIDARLGHAQYFNQILTAVFDVLDDYDSSIRELALSLMLEMLIRQKEVMEDSVEVVIEKLLNAVNDSVAKVSNEANQCLTVVLAQYDKFRCLSVVVPLLGSDDENMLVTCINCLTKLVNRLSQEELLSQLPSFLPSIFDAFGSQSLDVRKGVVFFLVDIYILLGKSFLPYLEGLSSTQLRLFSIYANRISQARSIATGQAKHG